MPEMSGVEMAEKLHGQGNQIPLIMLTTEERCRLYPKSHGLWS